MRRGTGISGSGHQRPQGPGSCLRLDIPEALLGSAHCTASHAMKLCTLPVGGVPPALSWQVNEVTGPEYLTNGQTLGSSFCHMPGPGSNTFQGLFHNSPGRWVPSLFSCCSTRTTVCLVPRWWFVPLSMHQHIWTPGFHRPLVAFRRQ